MKNNYIIKYTVGIILFIFGGGYAHGAIGSVSCSSSSSFSNTCTQCFTESTNVYLGYGAVNLSDRFNSSFLGDYIYPDENPNIWNVRPLYTNGEIEVGPGGFHYTPNLTDLNGDNGEFMLDGLGFPYIHFNPNTSGDIVESDAGFFVKFGTLSPAIIAGGRGSPLFEFQYNVNYYNADGNYIPKASHECVLYYPSWCGDNVTDGVNGETCDDGNNINGDGCSAICQNEAIATTCDSLVAVPAIGNSPLTTNITCNATNASSFNIEVLDSAGTVLNTFPTQNGTVTLNAVGNYSARCTVNGTITSPACIVPITVTTPVVGPTCDSITATPASGATPLTTTLSCAATNATSFNLEVFDSSGALVTTFPTQTGSVTLNATGSYNARCTINGTITSPTCNTAITVTTPVVPPANQCGDGIRQVTEQCDPNDPTRSGFGSLGCSAVCIPLNPGGGGGSGPNCTQIQVATTTLVAPTRSTPITCSGNSQALRFRIDCGNGQEVQGNGSIVVGQPGMHFTGVCDYSSSSTGTLFTPSCFAGGASGIPSNGALVCTDRVTLTDGSNGGGGGGSGVCGDGVLQRPNSNGQMEQCERLIAGGFPSWCNSTTCTVNFTTDPTVCVTGACPITIPSEGEIIFEPADSIVIGNGMNPFLEILAMPLIRNRSSYPIYLDQLCVSYSGSTLNGNRLLCENLGNLNPGDEFKFPDYPNYTGNTTTIPVGQSFAENTLSITIQHEGELYDWAYFTQPFNVRVARPSVATTGGGTSFVSGGATTNRLSNISNIASGLAGFETEENKNFVGTSVSDLSSYSKDDLDTSVRDTVEADGTNFVEDVNASLPTSTPSVGANPPTTLISEFGSYNGIENVYVLNGKDFKLSQSDIDGSSGPNGPSTYIINNGDLIIEGNVSYPDNIAFVVKGGNIIIDNVVSNVTGVYISIPLSGVGGDIKGTTGTTNTVLTVDGSLYGDISDLSLKRTYIRDTGSQISVGTIVSFASGLFRRPAPLVSQFIEEYMQSEKIAK